VEWLSVWSEVQTCIWPSWCHCCSLSFASVKSRLVLPFWYRLTWVVPGKGLLDGCVCQASKVLVAGRAECNQTQMDDCCLWRWIWPQAKRYFWLLYHYDWKIKGTDTVHITPLRTVTSSPYSKCASWGSKTLFQQNSVFVHCVATSWNDFSTLIISQYQCTKWISPVFLQYITPGNY